MMYRLYRNSYWGWELSDEQEEYCMLDLSPDGWSWKVETDCEITAVIGYEPLLDQTGYRGREEETWEQFLKLRGEHA